uniref:SFRICE_041476 n=1 Tax=Spodoptera frugiperda TaxID=7108 RepID=A0A2H1WRH6_SPOFR
MVQCKSCKLSLARAKVDSIVKCNGCEGVFHKKCAVKIKAFNDSGLCDECQVSQIDRPSPIDIDMSHTTPEKLLAEVNQKLEIVFNMKKTLETMSDDISFYAEKYQQLIEEKEKSDKKIKALEHKNVHLETCNKALEERLAYLEVREKGRNIEICGLEEQKNENPADTVKTIASKLGVDSGMIAEAMRVGVETKSESKQRENKPRPIVITLATRSERDKWLATRKSHQLTNDDIFANGNKQRIYINEDLTKYTRNLLWTAKNELKPKFKYIWVQNGRVLIKKDDPNDTKIRSIRTLSDINIYVENK